MNEIEKPDVYIIGIPKAIRTLGPLRPFQELQWLKVSRRECRPHQKLTVAMLVCKKSLYEYIAEVHNLVLRYVSYKS